MSLVFKFFVFIDSLRSELGNKIQTRKNSRLCLKSFVKLLESSVEENFRPDFDSTNFVGYERLQDHQFWPLLRVLVSAKDSIKSGHSFHDVTHLLMIQSFVAHHR